MSGMSVGHYIGDEVLTASDDISDGLKFLYWMVSEVGLSE